MINTVNFRLLSPGNNERGDLFARLIKDLFFALGYGDLRLNVHKSGREVDIQGKHRLESQRLIAECKAHAEKIGGDDINKFLGVLTRERKASAPSPVVGYFVSLNGFTETAIEQEKDADEKSVILIDGQRAVEELVRSRAVVGIADAVERAGQCAQHHGLKDAKLDGYELLGHARGYIWAIFYSRGKARTHYALVYADGTPLAASVAKEILDVDLLCGGGLESLLYLAPNDLPPDRVKIAEQAVGRYKQWVGEECGFIHLDGLPADTDLSATRLRLERLFVPLKVLSVSKPDVGSYLERNVENPPVSIGEMLAKSSHLAVLATPGGGKSTLLKRLAMAYAFPEKRVEISDKLPERDWLPLILKCRELRDRAHRPILELLDDIPLHVGFDEGESSAFREYVHPALRQGKCLLLIDGLDEISEEGARRAFAQHLRTFIAMFPQTGVVVTSREAGFRLVAGVVASTCSQVRLAPLDISDVKDLCERWHVEVIADNETVRKDAKKLGEEIWANHRIRALAENPLLLTTLLVVKRCVRELPRSRATLYREAIRVLVRTWNIEGYAPLDEGETLCQLSYVACTMMEEGKQQIGQKALLKLLQNARHELEAELQFAGVSPQQFVERIEYRSSLIMQVGHADLDGEVQPVYEFRHLTFQEYLAARGYVEEQYSGREAGKNLVDLLGKHFADERWAEVIPLAAVLAGRKAEGLILRLTSACERRSISDIKHAWETREPLGNLLYQCVRDEVQITSPTLRAALRELARGYQGEFEEYSDRSILEILRGKFGGILAEVVENAYLSGVDGFHNYNTSYERVAGHLQFGDAQHAISPELADSLRAALESGSRTDKVRAALVCMELAYSYSGKKNNPPENHVRDFFQMLSPGLCGMLKMEDLPCALAASWALAWIGEHRLLHNPIAKESILMLYRLWRDMKSREQSRYPAWAFAEQELLPRDTFNKEVWGDCDLFLQEFVSSKEQIWRNIRHGAYVVGWYRRAPWRDVHLVKSLRKCVVGDAEKLDPTVRDLLINLGGDGEKVIAAWEQRRKEAQARWDKLSSEPELADGGR